MQRPRAENGDTKSLYKKLLGPGLAEAMLRVCISSWLGARMAITALRLAASVVKRKKWQKLPPVS